jgi:hypothetical protein
MQHNPIIMTLVEITGVCISFNSQNKGQTINFSLQTLPPHSKQRKAPQRHIHGDYFPKRSDVFSEAFS